MGRRVGRGEWGEGKRKERPEEGMGEEEGNGNWGVVGGGIIPQTNELGEKELGLEDGEWDLDGKVIDKGSAAVKSLQRERGRTQVQHVLSHRYRDHGKDINMGGSIAVMGLDSLGCVGWGFFVMRSLCLLDVGIFVVLVTLGSGCGSEVLLELVVGCEA
ncbi:hypothetical protein Tco_0520670 [Tanacetum coccineum]